MGEKDLELQAKLDMLRFVKTAVEKSKKEISTDWETIKETAPQTKFDHSSQILRRYGRGWEFLEEWGLVDFDELEKLIIEKHTRKIPNYKSTSGIQPGGVHYSDKLIQMDAQQEKDEEYLLNAHGFDPNIWEITSAKNSIYDVNAKGGISKTHYSSKISVKKKKNAFNLDNFLEKIEKIKPRTVKRLVTEGKGMLSVGFVDQHFGINSYSSYENKIAETQELFESKKWDTIYFPIGNDLLHTNNHKAETVNGTKIEAVDLNKAKEDAFRFYVDLIDSALKNSVNVVADYIPGNHDADLSWMFVSMLAKMYPQVKWNTSMETKKMFRWENILLVNLHGDKGLSRVAEALVTEYRDFMVGATTVEIHSGHLHAEKVIDKYGVLVRTLPTDAKTDQWHRDNTFEGATKISQIFEYNENILKHVHLVG